MFRARRVLAALGVALALSTVSAGAPAGRDNVKEGLKALFDAGWQRTLKAREEARQRFEQLKSAAPGDWRVPYAYALVQIRQLRYADAVKSIDEVLAADKKHLNARKIKAWLLAITKEHNGALAEMERLSDLFPPEDAVGEADSTYRDAAAFLGRLYGYFESPAKESVDELLLVKCRQHVTDRLTASRRAAFEEGRRSVTGQFSASSEEVKQKSAAAEAEAAKQKERSLEELNRKDEETTSEIETAEARNAKLKNDLDYELDKIGSSEREVVSNMQRIESQAVAVRQELAALDDRIARLLDRTEREKDPNEKQRMLNDASFWRTQRVPRLAALDDLNRRYASLGADRAALQQRRQTALTRYQRETGRADMLRRTLDRVRADQAKTAGQPVTGNTPSVREHKRRAAAMTTYVPLPLSLEGERDRLLESVK